MVGRDTRWSGPLLQAALSAGLAAEGVDVVDLGVLPTPGVAAVAAARGLPAAVISASHNPYPDNGIKLFAAGGRKLSEAEEQRGRGRPRRLTGPASAGGRKPGGGRRVGDSAASRPIRTARAWYCDRVVGALEGRRLDGIRVVVDCANGAAVGHGAGHPGGRGGRRGRGAGRAPPTARNINAGCGSTDPSGLAAAVVAPPGRRRPGLRR